MTRTHTPTPIWWIASLLLCLIAPPTYAQQEFRSAGKGASTALPITGSVFDIGAYEYIVAAGGSGGMTTTPAWDTPRRSPLWRR